MGGLTKKYCFHVFARLGYTLRFEIVMNVLHFLIFTVLAQLLEVEINAVF